jgi:hypothetical protein
VRFGRIGTFVAMAVLATGALFGAAPAAVIAQEPTCTPETEPNDVADPLPFLTGPFCTTGTLPQNDQDLSLWELSADDATTPWTMTVDGVAGTLTGLQVVPITSEPGVVPITAGSRIAGVDSTPDDYAPVVRSGLLLPAGRYIVGISRSGLTDGSEPLETGYQYSVERADPLPPSGDAEPNDTPETASPVSGAFDISGDAATTSDYLGWTVDGTPEGTAWTLALAGTLGRGLGLSLLGPDGSELASVLQDAWGQVVFPDLRLEAGRYVIEVSGATADAASYRLSATSGPAGPDAEPNDRTENAVVMDPATPLARGRLYPAGDRDQFRLTIPADAAPTLRDIKVLGPDDLRRQVCITTPDGQSLQCREAIGGVALRSLVLAPGDYVVTVSGDPDPDRPYVLRIDATATAVPDYETEPNDTPDLATPFDPSIEMRGLGSPDDTDMFRLTTSGDAQLWQVQLTGTGVDRLAWIRADGTVLGEGYVDPDHVTGTLTDLYLVPGEHWFRASGGGDYRISVTPLGPPDPNAEREPNDTAAFAQPYRLGRTEVVGRLPSPVDQDVYRFSLAATERVTLLVEPPADGAATMRLETGGQTLALRRDGGPGTPTRMEVLLEPGDYEVWLYPGTPSSDRYRFSLERGDPFSVRADEEPNDRVEQARALPATLEAEGTLDSGDDYDWYTMPPIDPATPVTVTFTGGASGAILSDGVTELTSAWDPATLTLTSDGTSGIAPRALGVYGAGPYSLRVEAAGLVPAAAPAPLAVKATLSLATDTVAAYWPAGQRVTGNLELTNDGDAAVDLALDTLTSHFAWTATVAEPEVTLAAGETRQMPVEVAIGADAWADEPVRITVRARAADGAGVTGAALITPRGEAEPVAPEQAWSVPEPLRGGLDVASLALGAVTIPSIDGVQEDLLHDGLAHTGMGFSQDVSLLPVTLTVDLAGDAPVPVAGFGLDPLAGDALPGDVPRDVELLLSTDGVTFTSAATATLSTLMADQWVVLPEPVPATHAQLRISSVHGGGFAKVILGEWKVIATPGVAPIDTPIDLAQPVRGGHISWMEPQPADPALGPAFLDEDPTFAPLYLDGGTSVTWAIGFQDDRAAQLTGMEWVDPQPSTEGQRFKEVSVELSMEGPAGPWLPAGTWALDRAADGSVAPFTFPEPTWARSVKLTGQGPRKEDSAWDPPSTIRILERATGSDYRSILGEWGSGEPVGPYEWLVPPDLSVPSAQADDNDTPETADPITAGTPVTGRVDGRTDIDWYTFTVPDGDNSLDLVVAGKPLVVVALTLTDTEGFEVPMLFGAGQAPGTVRYQAEVTPGATYRLKVEQPPSSIVFTYDTSGSMGPYLDYVYQAMRAFTADVTPGEEAISIVPFEEHPLLDDWSDDPYALQDAVSRYVAYGGSSSVETALIDASTALSAREGARAVLIVSDAETSSFDRTAELWRIFASVRPLVFGVHVGATSEPASSTHMMQDWTRVAGGFYQYTRSHGEMDRAFDRLATWLRRPAGYVLDLSTGFQEEPPPSAEPGSISVASPASGAAATLSGDVGVEIILDTSGSMLKAIKGKPRIDLAKTVLADLVSNRLPPGAPVAVRVLGDQADVCGTRLVVPLAPLDPAAVIDQVNAIDVVQEADTPLGAALRAVPEDLSGSTGTRIVLLITDSEEIWPNPDLCGDDPAAAIRDLRRRGIDARLNIVGLQVDAKKATAQLRKWARLGNGSFFGAKDAEQLGRSIRTAVSAPFRILDAAGNEVASGTVDGDGVPVKPGVYSVVVLTDPVARFDGIEIKPGEGEALTLPEPAPEPSLEPLPTAAP